MSTSLLKRFVEYLEHVEATLVRAGCVREKMVLFATLAPGTTEKEYESQTHPVVHYFGPYTVVTYKDGDYHFQRVAGDSQWYWNCRSEREGVTLTATFRQLVTVSLETLATITHNAAQRYSTLSQGKGGTLTLKIHIPLDDF